MKKFPYLSLVILLFLSVACNKSEPSDTNNPDGKDPDPDPIESVTYDLSSVNDSGVTGTATLIRNNDGTSTIYIELENALDGVHPAAVHYNSIAEGGAVAITLNECECQISETVITKLDNGTAISFDQLMVFDGYLNIYQSETNLDKIIAHTNIGSNAF